MRPAQKPAAPWRPTAASWATLFLLPVAGGLVTAVNLLRMRRADKAIFAVSSSIATLLFILFLWTQGRAFANYLLLSYIVVMIGDVGLFLYLQQEDWQRWRKDHPKDQPASGWEAAVWAMLGFSFTLMIAFIWLVGWVLLTYGTSLTLPSGGV